MPKTKAGELAKVESIEAIERKEKRMEVGRARTVKELENIAIRRGYSMRWVTKMAELKGINKHAARARHTE